MAWIRLVERAPEPGTPTADFEFGPFRLRRDGVLFAHDAPVDLTPTEEAFLRTLVEARGARVGKEEIAARAWPMRAPSDASLARCLHTLRRKLRAAAPSTPRVVATSYRRGFSLCLPVRRVEDARRASGPRAVGD